MLLPFCPSRLRPWAEEQNPNPEGRNVDLKMRNLNLRGKGFGGGQVQRGRSGWEASVAPWKVLKIVCLTSPTQNAAFSF